ncbi:hypothetical protein SDC9_74768 [bioreactor metagenome]|uniref:Uncharacterized protein n=1 Tax=bioreactor metagenome TaxID=1076179 RepID=A0A644YJQ4_9ZZZZ
MGYDLTKLPRKLKKLTFAVLAYAFCLAVFNLAYVTAGPHLFPADFVLNSEERLYQLFTSGGYCWTDGKVIGVLPPYKVVG